MTRELPLTYAPERLLARRAAGWAGQPTICTATCCTTTRITASPSRSGQTAARARNGRGGCCSGRAVVAGERHFVGKETDRRWEYGEDLSLKHFKAMEYRPARKMVTADATVRRAIASVGMRAMMRRTGLSQHTLEAIRAGRRVRHTTLQRVIAISACGPGS